jgi:hypothetical protein
MSMAERLDKMHDGSGNCHLCESAVNLSGATRDGGDFNTKL